MNRGVERLGGRERDAALLQKVAHALLAVAGAVVEPGATALLLLVEVGEQEILLEEGGQAT